MGGKLTLKLLLLLGCGLDALFVILSLGLPKWVKADISYSGLWAACIDRRLQLESQCLTVDTNVCKQTLTLFSLHTSESVNLNKYISDNGV